MRALAFLAALTCALLPFEYLGTVEVVGFTLKLHYLTGAALVIATVWRPGFFQKRDAWLGAFLGWATLVTILASPLPARSLPVLVTWWYVAALYLALRMVWRDQAMRTRALRYWLVGALVAALIAVVQVVGTYAGIDQALLGMRPLYQAWVLGFPRPHATLLEPLYLAGYLTAPTLLLLQGRRTWQWLVGCLGVVLIVATVSRGAYLGFAVGVVVLLGCMALQKRNALPILLTVVVGVLLGIGSIRLHGSEAYRRFLGHSTAQEDRSGVATDSVSGRLAQYQAAWREVRRAPITGGGVATFGPRTQSQARGVNEYQIVNNQYLELLQEVGVVGMFLFVIWLVGELRKVRSGVWAAALVALAVQYLTFSTLSIAWVWVLLAFSVSRLPGKVNTYE